jgi:hypothetical protein
MGFGKLAAENEGEDQSESEEAGDERPNVTRAPVPGRFRDARRIVEGVVWKIDSVVARLVLVPARTIIRAALRARTSATAAPQTGHSEGDWKRDMKS